MKKKEKQTEAKKKNLFWLQVMLAQIDSAVVHIRENTGEEIFYWFAVVSDYWLRRLKVCASKVDGKCEERKQAQEILSKDRYLSPEGAYLKVVRENQLDGKSKLRNWNLTVIGFETLEGWKEVLGKFPGIGTYSHGADHGTILFEDESHPIEAFCHACFTNYLLKVQRPIDVVRVSDAITKVQDVYVNRKWKCPECGETVLISRWNQSQWDGLARDYDREIKTTRNTTGTNVKTPLG